MALNRCTQGKRRLHVLCHGSPCSPASVAQLWFVSGLLAAAATGQVWVSGDSNAPNYGGDPFVIDASSCSGNVCWGPNDSLGLGFDTFGSNDASSVHAVGRVGGVALGIQIVNGGSLWNNGGWFQMVTLEDDATFSSFAGGIEQIFALDNATARMSGGLIEYLWPQDTSTVEIIGGHVASWSASDDAQVTISGGDQSSGELRNHASLVLEGGTAGDIQCFDDCLVVITGGTCIGTFFHTSRAELHGGSADMFFTGHSSAWVTGGDHAMLLLDGPGVQASIDGGTVDALSCDIGSLAELHAGHIGRVDIATNGRLRIDGRSFERSPDGIAWEPVPLGEYGTGSVLDGQLLRDHTADWTIDQPLLIFDNGVVELINRCPQDLTGDGTVDSLDVLLFLGAWAQGNDLADWDDNGTVNTLDFLAFLNDWVTGC